MDPCACQVKREFVEVARLSGSAVSTVLELFHSSLAASAIPGTVHDVEMVPLSISVIYARKEFGYGKDGCRMRHGLLVEVAVERPYVTGPAELRALPDPAHERTERVCPVASARMSRGLRGPGGMPALRTILMNGQPIRAVGRSAHLPALSLRDLSPVHDVPVQRE